HNSVGRIPVIGEYHDAGVHIVSDVRGYLAYLVYELCVGKDQLRQRVAQLVRQQATLIREIDGTVDRARFPAGEQKLRGQKAVRCEHRDAVAFDDAMTCQVSGYRIGDRAKLSEAKFLVRLAVVYAYGIRTVSHPVIEPFGQGRAVGGQE